MRHSTHHAVLWAAAVLAVAVPTGAPAQSGAVKQTVPPPISQNPAVPPLQLSNADRDKVRQALSSKDTEVNLKAKATRSAQSFDPKVGAVIPTSLKPHPLPRPLIYEIPLLRRYTYVKFKHQVLIVNPMNRKIVDVFPEQTT
jgi:hypothetical protein